MDEKETNEEQVKPTNDTREGNKPEASTLIDDTNLAAKRMEEATKEAREERMLAEESYQKMRLGGGSEGAVEKVTETEDQKWAREAKVRYAGTGMDPTE